MPTKNYKVTVSYESDTAPIETWRGTFVAANAKSASVKAGRAAKTHWPKGRKFRSWVIVIESLSEPEDTPQTLDSEPRAATHAKEDR